MKYINLPIFKKSYPEEGTSHNDTFHYYILVYIKCKPPLLQPQEVQNFVILGLK